MLLRYHIDPYAWARPSPTWARSLLHLNPFGRLIVDHIEICSFLVFVLMISNNCAFSSFTHFLSLSLFISLRLEP